MQLSSGRKENMRKKGTSTKTRAMANVEKYDDGDDVEEEIRHVKDVQIGKEAERKSCVDTPQNILIFHVHIRRLTYDTPNQGACSCFFYFGLLLSARYTIQSRQCCVLRVFAKGVCVCACI